MPVWLLFSAEATEVTAVTQSRTNTSRSIFWSPVEFGKCNIHYVVKLYSGDELLLDDTTKNCFYRFNSKYMNSTSFRIWAIVEKEKGNDLPDIETGKVIFFLLLLSGRFFDFLPTVSSLNGT